MHQPKGDEWGKPLEWSGTSTQTASYTSGRQQVFKRFSWLSLDTQPTEKTCLPLDNTANRTVEDIKVPSLLTLYIQNGPFRWEITEGMLQDLDTAGCLHVAWGEVKVW